MRGHPRSYCTEGRSWDPTAGSAAPESVLHALCHEATPSSLLQLRNKDSLASQRLGGGSGAAAGWRESAAPPPGRASRNSELCLPHHHRLPELCDAMTSLYSQQQVRQQLGGENLGPSQMGRPGPTCRLRCSRSPSQLMRKKLTEPKVSQTSSCQVWGPPAFPSTRWAGEGTQWRAGPEEESPAEPSGAVPWAVPRGLRDPWERLWLSLSLAKEENDAWLQPPEVGEESCVSGISLIQGKTKAGLGGCVLCCICSASAVWPGVSHCTSQSLHILFS